MLNPRPPLLPAADPKSPSTADSTYESDKPYEQKLPHPLNIQRHRWFEVFDIGALTRSVGGGQSYASPLAAGATVTYSVDQKPDFWMVGIVVNSAGAQLKIWLGPGRGGHPIRIGNGGRVIIPCQGDNVSLTIGNDSGQSVVGTVIAIAGFDAHEMTMIDYLPASQA